MHKLEKFWLASPIMEMFGDINSAADGFRHTKMTPPLQLLAIQKIGNELAVAWNDKVENYLQLEFLRRSCPCAACGGEPDVMGLVARPRVSYGEGSFELLSYQIVGGYGVQPKWGDGHSTGIYSYSYLRRLGEVQASS